MKNTHKQLKKLIDRIIKSFNQGNNFPRLQEDEIQFIAEFDNLLILLDLTLVDLFSKAGSDQETSPDTCLDSKQSKKRRQQNIDRQLLKQDSYLYLLEQGLTHIKIDFDNEVQKDRDFGLLQCIESRLTSKFSQANNNELYIIRDIIGVLFKANFQVNESFLSRLNEVEYHQDEVPFINDDSAMEHFISQFDEMLTLDGCDSDYDIYMMVSEQLNQMPEEAASLLMFGLLKTKSPVTRDAALLLLLHPLEKVRRNTLEHLSSMADRGLLNSKDFRRLMMIRHWLTEPDKKIVDDVIKKLQRAQLIQQPEDTSQLPIHDIHLSPIDNSGCMGLQIIFKHQKKYQMFGCVLKQSYGIKDSFISENFSKKEYDRLLAQLTEEMPVISISETQLSVLLCHFIVANITNNHPLSAEWITYCEYLGLRSLPAQSMNFAAALEILKNTRTDRAELEVEEFLFGWASPEYAEKGGDLIEIINREFEPFRDIWYERLLITVTCFGFILDDVAIFLESLDLIAAGEKLVNIELFQQLAALVLMNSELEEMENPESLLDSLLNQPDKLLVDNLPDWNSEPIDRDDDVLSNHAPLKWHSEQRPKRACYQIKISLKDSKPAIWRRVVVMNTIKLSKLHQIIQVAMGWDDQHLYQFTHNRDIFCCPTEFIDCDYYDDDDVQLRDLLYKEKSKLEYCYDFGDSWHHQILLEKIIPAKRKNTAIKVIKGVGTCPPEDVGGIPGYERLITIINQPDHEEYEELRECYGLADGERLDPSLFDMDETNQFLDEYFN